MTFLKSNSSAMVAAIAVVIGLSAPAAQAAVVDYVGYGWETGGLPPSQPGDVLAFATVVTQIDPLFEVDLNSVEATLYISGLVSTGEVYDAGSGNTIISYTGGTIGLYSDPSHNSDWGINPPNATVPSTFTDGSLVLSGDFTSFTLIIQPSGLGIFEGYIDGTGGSALSGPCSNCAYTFSGTFAAPTGAQIPDGYDLQIDGNLDVESAVGVDPISWGSLKQLYNQNR